MGWSDDMAKRIAAAELRARKRIAALVAEVQQDLIDSRQSPTGPQQANADSYAKSKKGKPPLNKTGLLRDPSTWRISGRESIKVRPPADRSAAVAILEDMGFGTVFSGMPASFKEKAQRIVDEELAKG